MKESKPVIAAYIIYFLTVTIWTVSARLLEEGIIKFIAVSALTLIFTLTFLWLIRNNIRRLLEEGEYHRRAVFAILVNFLIMIHTYALIYSSLGIQNNTSDGDNIVHSFEICLYYSIVTFTTLGYGDFYPVGTGRAVAAIQALTGFVVLGLVASTAVSVLKPKTN
jgi:hypothetical protein